MVAQKLSPLRQFQFWKKIAVVQSILELEECSRCQNLAKKITSFLFLFFFCSHLSGFFSFYNNSISWSPIQPQYGCFDHTEADSVNSLSHVFKAVFVYEHLPFISKSMFVCIHFGIILHIYSSNWPYQHGNNSLRWSHDNHPRANLPSPLFDRVEWQMHLAHLFDPGQSRVYSCKMERKQIYSANIRHYSKWGTFESLRRHLGDMRTTKLAIDGRT